MSKKFKYANGFEGVVNDGVAVILEKKGQGKVVGESPKDDKADDGKPDEKKGGFLGLGGDKK